MSAPARAWLRLTGADLAASIEIGNRLAAEDEAMDAAEAEDMVGYHGTPPLSEAGRSAQSASAKDLPINFSRCCE